MTKAQKVSPDIVYQERYQEMRRYRDYCPSIHEKIFLENSLRDGF